MSLCEGTSGSFFCPNSLTRLNEIYCCGVSGLQSCCDHDTYSNVFTNVGQTTVSNDTIVISVGAIIGIAVGALVLIIGLFVCCCWCCSCCCFAKRHQPGMVLVPASNPITIMNNTPPNQGYSHLVENYGGELQPVAAPPPYFADYRADPHGRK